MKNPRLVYRYYLVRSTWKIFTGDTILKANIYCGIPFRKRGRAEEYQEKDRNTCKGIHIDSVIVKLKVPITVDIGNERYQ